MKMYIWEALEKKNCYCCDEKYELDHKNLRKQNFPLESNDNERESKNKVEKNANMVFSSTSY